MGSKWEKVCVYVPKEMKELMEKRVKQLAHSGMSEYLRSLIREDLLKSGIISRGPREKAAEQ